MGDSPSATLALYAFDPVSFVMPMISPLSLANGLTLLFAVLCLWTMISQSRGGTTTLGRVALPGGFAVISALMLLAGVVEANLLDDVLWVVAFVIGSILGRVRGWALVMRADAKSGKIWLERTVDGVLVAALLATLATVDFTSAAMGELFIEPAYVAAGSALCGGFLGYRMLVIALRVVRPTRGELSKAA